MKRERICRWFGHKRRSLDTKDGRNVNIDVCDRCDGTFVAKSDRWARYIAR